MGQVLPWCGEWRRMRSSTALRFFWRVRGMCGDVWECGVCRQCERKSKNRGREAGMERGLVKGCAREKRWGTGRMGSRCLTMRCQSGLFDMVGLCGRARGRRRLSERSCQIAHKLNF